MARSFRCGPPLGPLDSLPPAASILLPPHFNVLMRALPLLRLRRMWALSHPPARYTLPHGFPSDALALCPPFAHWFFLGLGGSTPLISTLSPSAVTHSPCSLLLGLSVSILLGAPSSSADLSFVLVPITPLPPSAWSLSYFPSVPLHCVCCLLAHAAAHTPLCCIARCLLSASVLTLGPPMAHLYPLGAPDLHGGCIPFCSPYSMVSTITAG